MALKTLVLFSLLVLGPLVMVRSQTPAAQRFKKNHIDHRDGPFSDNYCNKIMQERKLLNKPFNTFVHESLEAIQAVCHERNFCRNGKNNCYESKRKMSITECNLKSRHPPEYQTINRKAFIIIGCAGNPLMPVHFDCSCSSPADAG
ncbi:PREDICTED: ribonuclease pancreatic-like [Condylura cristata]|uniref:ribonuclease pancreatic-like n=1 Tax=Condylura cristata TaxID=143302 RepID=UPI0003344907|nr:PREDICTED: ribonuclease pancreatic-like [Condylura cristata]